MAGDDQARIGIALPGGVGLLEKVFRNSPAAIAVVRLRPPAILHINEAYERMFGWRREEVIGRDPGELRIWVDDAERERFRATLDAEGRLVNFLSRARRQDGALIDTLNSAEVIEGGEDKIALLIVLDITERVRSERALHESRERFRALVDLSSDWYWRTDTEHRFVFRDGEILRRMNLPVEADYGKTRWELGFGNLTEADWAAHRATLAARKEFRGFLASRHGRDGNLYWAELSGTPLFAADGEFLGYHGTGRDVTAQVEAEQALRQLNAELERKVAERTAELDATNRELESFAFSVSHDLRTPLRAIDGFSQMLLDSHAATLDQEGLRLLGRVRGAAQRMGGIITDLLAMAKVSRTPVRYETLDLSALAAEVIGELAHEARGREVQWRIAPGLEARGDRGLLRIVLTNLLGNALKYSRDAAPARIEVGALADESNRRAFFVRDNGIGFDMAYRDQLFQPFQRLHSARQFEGTGVGLATVRRVIAKHGGEIDADSTLGAGATFRFTLPF